MPTKKIARNNSESDDRKPGLGGSAEKRDNLSQESLDEAQLAEMRQNLEKPDQKNAPFVNTGSLSNFFRKVTDKLKPVALPSTKSLETPPDSTDAQIFPKQPNPAGTRKLFPFTESEPFPGNLPQSSNANVDPRKTGKSSPRLPDETPGTRLASGMNPLGSKKNEIDTPLSKFTQRLESQHVSPNIPEKKALTDHFERNKQLPHLENQKNPFVEDETQFPWEEREETLAEKIRKGSVPADTLRLLITSSMAESEVLAICNELKIDWGAVPGNTREEKTQYLIENFHSNKTLVDYKETAYSSLHAQLHSNEQQDWSDSDARLKELQEVLGGPEVFTGSNVDTDEKKISFFGQLSEDFAQASRLQKVLVVGLSMIVITLIVVIGFVAFPASSPIVTAPSPSLPPLSVPSPIALELPGGWTFALKAGTVQDGSWKPDGPEWLLGTEICKLVSIPWNRQLDAIYGTIQPGDELLLTMSNTELLRFKVTERKTFDLIDFDSSELKQMANGTSPCLAIILTKDDAVSRQMVVAVPVILAPWEPGMTATPVVTETLNPAFPTVTIPAPTSVLPTQKP